MFPRYLASPLHAALGDNPVVFLHGARQTGKSTLAQSHASASRYLTLDDPSLLSAAVSDPQGFVAGLSGPVVLDEVQRCPELFLPIKAEVDRKRTRGRFLLTGSASILVLPELAHSLVGRMEVLTLRSLSQGEIESTPGGLIDTLFETAPLPEGAATGSADLWRRIAAGGFPEAVKRRNAERRSAWFESYLTTLVQRDVRDLAEIEGLTRLPDILRLLASRIAGLLNFAEFSRTTQISQTTLKRYFALLEGTFLVQRLPAWTANRGKRLVKSPKIFLLDSGLAMHLLNLDAEHIADAGPARGAILENFVLTELEKQAGWSRTQPRIYHYRSHSGVEVDFVLEDRRGCCVAIEVKAAATVSAADLRGVRAFAEALGKKFVRGILLYTGRETIPFGERLHALPVASLWSAQAAT